MLCFSPIFCQFIINHGVQSQPNNFADRQYARIHRAPSEMLLVTCKWRYCCRSWAFHGVSGVPIGALLAVPAAVAFGCVCLSHVSGWLRLVEVFTVVPLGVSCFLSCPVGGYLVARQNVEGAGKLFHRGIRI